MRRANRRRKRELILERYAATSQKISAAIRFLAPEPQRPQLLNFQPSNSGSADQRPRRHGAAVRGSGPREFQIRLRARREFESGPCRWTATFLSSASASGSTPTVFSRRWISKTSLRSKPVRPPSGILWPTPATAARWKSNCAPKCSKAKTPSFSNSAGRRKNCAHGKQLPADADVRLTVRVDIEDRNFHCETKRNGGADFHFSSNTHAFETMSTWQTHYRPAPASPSRPRRTASCACLPTPANIIRSRNGAKTFRIPSSRRAARPAAATPTAPAGLKLPLAKGANVDARRDGGNVKRGTPSSARRKSEIGQHAGQCRHSVCRAT